MSPTQHPSPEDLTLYAMGSLPPDEAAVIRAHSAGCDECRAEISRVHLDLAHLALDVPVAQPSAGARQRLLARVENEVSLPGFRESAAPASRKLVAMPSAAARKTEQVDYAARAPHAFPDSTRPDSARPDSARSFAWTPWVLAAVCLVLAAGMGIDNRGLRDRLQQLTQTSQQLQSQANRANDILAVLTAPTAQRVTLTAGQVPPQPTGRANYLRDRGQLIFTANNLAALPQGKVYELWLIPVSGAPIPAGTFAPDTQGSASVVFPQIPVGVEAKAFGVTVEPAGGSSAPTSTILLQGT